MILIHLLLLFSLRSYGHSIVETPQGKLRGVTELDINGNEFYSFLSIPYITPPIGKLRFKAPRKPKPWSGVFEATQDLLPCPQLQNGEIVGQEDCVKLNLHTPELPSNKSSLKPVVVFIHGGIFVGSSGSKMFFGAEFMMIEKIVLITINYRLGQLGFMSSTNESIPVSGNAGLKDQVMALRWIKKNVKYFGGDPNSVTLMGQSAGAACVHYHVLSNLSKGLFHKAILMSGSVGNEWAHGTFGTFEMQAKILNITENVLETMQKMSYSNFFNFDKLYGWLIPMHGPFYSSPVVERKTNNKMPMITKPPLEIISSNNYNKIPIMMGYTNGEGLSLDIVNLLTHNTSYVVKFENLVSQDCPHNQQFEEYVNDVKTFYLNNLKIKDSAKYVTLLSDIYIINGYIKIIKQLIENEDEIYFYRFISDTKLNYFKRQFPETANFPGASHVDDLGYLFKTILTPEITPGSIEDKSMRRTVRLFTNFIKHGSPTLASDNINWPPITKKNFNFMEIANDGLVLGENPDAERFEFWQNIYKKYC